ncbi:MAG: HEPN domain-containing protein [Oscillospiraceae bacterium]|nr:HEPN domain-containing protein [Oscillospiraceae bacterium]
MPDDNRLAYAKYRLDTARVCLNSAKILLENGDFKSAANRSYYCIFHAMRAVLAIDTFDSKKHSGIISMFRQKYIKTGIFAAEFSDVIENAFSIRNKSDYDDFFVISKEEVTQQIANARVFLEAVENYIGGL